MLQRRGAWLTWECQEAPPGLNMVGYGWVNGVTQSKSLVTEVSPRLGDGLTGTFSRWGFHRKMLLMTSYLASLRFVVVVCLFVLFWIWFCYGVCDLRQGTVPMSRLCFTLQMRALHLLGGPPGKL